MKANTQQNGLSVECTLSVQMLWQYREFNRLAIPAPAIMFDAQSVGFVMGRSLPALAQDIAKNGLKQPIQLAVWNGKALVNDGNHRLTIYKMDNQSTIRVQVTFYTDETAQAFFPEKTIKRFRAVNSELATALAGLPEITQAA